MMDRADVIHETGRMALWIKDKIREREESPFQYFTHLDIPKSWHDLPATAAASAYDQALGEFTRMGETNSDSDVGDLIGAAHYSLSKVAVHEHALFMDTGLHLSLGEVLEYMREVQEAKQTKPLDKPLN